MLNIAIWRGVGSAPRSGGVRGRGLAPFPWRRGLMAGRRTVIGFFHAARDSKAPLGGLGGARIKGCVKKEATHPSAR